MTASEGAPRGRTSPIDAEVLRVGQRLRDVARDLDERFLDKGELVRLMLVTLLAGEHMLLVGPPGTAKSALVRHLARLVDARYFEYLLTRFSEPNELFGPVDIRAFREGSYTRRTDGMLPEAEIVFLDEIFKSNSAILNALLNILNERTFANGSKIMKVPLLSLFVHRQYTELTQRAVLNPGFEAIPIISASQMIRFQLDESGAVLTSESEVRLANGDPEASKPRRLILDRPFLIYLQQHDAQEPYFVMWVENLEVLVPFRE